MPYTGPADQSLPRQVQRLPAWLRELWVEVFNDTHSRHPDNEGRAFRAAWAAVRQASDKKKEMGQMFDLEKVKAWLRGSGPEPAPGPEQDQEPDIMLELVYSGSGKIDGWHLWPDSIQPDGWPDAGVTLGTKGLELGAVMDAVHAAWRDQFADEAWLVNIMTDHVIATTGQPAMYYRIGYQMLVAAPEQAPEAQQVVQVSFDPRDQWTPVVPAYMELKAYDQPDGRIRWMLVSSGGWQDRDGELVSTEFLRSAVDYADKSGHRGPLLIYHVPGSDIGSCDFQAVVGEPGFLLESGLFADNERGRRAAAYYKQHAKQYGASIKFLYLNRSPDGVYEPPGVIVERSLLPRIKAAFPWSAVTLSEVTKMSSIDQEKLAELTRILGEEEANAILAQVEDGAATLKELGIRAKEALDAQADEPAEPDEQTQAEGAAQPEETAEVEPEEAAKETQEEPTAEVEPEPEPFIAAQPEPMELVLSPEALSAIAGEAEKAFEHRLAPVSHSLEILRAAVEKLAGQVQALQATDEQRIAEKVRALPRATVRALGQATYRPTEKQADQPTPEEERQSLQAKALRVLED